MRLIGQTAGLRTFVVLTLLCSQLAACCAGACSDTHLFLQSTAPTNVTGAGAGDAQVLAALEELLADRMYYPGTYVCTGGCGGDHDESRIFPGEVVTFLPAPVLYQPPADRVVGGGTRGSGRYAMAFNLPVGTLALDSDFNTTQGLIYEIRRGGLPWTSVARGTAAGRFQGTLAGQPVDLSFEVELLATKEAGFYGAP
jgi:hypothetical protein